MGVHGIKSRNVKDGNPLKYERFSAHHEDDGPATAAVSNVSFGKLWPASGEKLATFVITDVIVCTQTVGDGTASSLTVDVKKGGTSVCSTNPSIAKGATEPACSKDAGSNETAAVVKSDGTEEVASGTELLADLTYANTGSPTKGYGLVRVDVHGYWKPLK